MNWLVYPAHFLAGAFLANGVPHFVNGLSGRTFPSPFASPPGRGESSPLVNTLWGLANFVLGFLLLKGIGDYRLAFTLDTFSVSLGILAISITLAIHFGDIQKGKKD